MQEYSFSKARKYLVPIAAGLIVASAALAWTGPAGSPPSCPVGAVGCSAPLDTSGSAQTKTGTLNVNVTSGYGINITDSDNSIGLLATESNANGVGVRGTNSSTGSWGALGYLGNGVYGNSSGNTWAGNFLGTTYGLFAQGGSYGLYGYATNGGYGVYGQNAGNGYGVYGYAAASGAVGVRGDGYSWGGYFNGLAGQGVYAQASQTPLEAYNTSTGYWGEIGYSNYTIYGNGYLYGSGGYTGSDIRLKQNINDLPTAEGLAAILKLRPITFDWKDAKQNKDMGQQLGFIAQEVDPLIPDAVITTPDQTITLSDGTKESITEPMAVDYSKIVVPLVKAVQEQQQEIDELKNLNAQQQKEIDALKAQSSY